MKILISIFFFISAQKALAAPKVLDVVTGLNSSCALFESGRVKCWGYSDYGQLGLGDKSTRGATSSQMGDNLPYLDLGTSEKVISLHSSSTHVCAVFESGRAKCWGCGLFGRLLRGNEENYGDAPTEMGSTLPFMNFGTGLILKKLVMGRQRSCALFTNGKIKCWGIDQEGSLGTGLARNNLGDVPGETADGLPFVNLGAGAVAEDLFAGYFHTCALLEGGKIKCWGANSSGQLGLGDASSRGDGPDEMGDLLPPVSLGDGLALSSIVGGIAHTCALFTNGKVKCWGDNNFGQLGLGDGEDRGKTPETTPDKLPFVDLGVGQVATKIFAGENSTCVLFLNNTIKCFGENRRGTLGQGDAVHRGLSAAQMGDNLLPIYLGRKVSIQTMSVFLTHACAVTFEGLVKCWGSNDNSQLGIGNRNSVGIDPQDLGDNLPYVSLGTQQ